MRAVSFVLYMTATREKAAVRTLCCGLCVCVFLFLLWVLSSFLEIRYEEMEASDFGSKTKEKQTNIRPSVLAATRERLSRLSPGLLNLPKASIHAT